VGTSSLRRRCQIKYLRPDLQIVALRGNVDTRLRKLESTELDAIILAAAGLLRLGLAERIVEVLSPDIIVPAIGQGAMAIETRADDDRTNALISFLNHAATETAVRAERALLRRLGGGCAVPIAAFARIENERLHMIGAVGSPDGERLIRNKLSGDAAEAETVGRQLAEKLIDGGANQILSMLGTYHE
jgi:hydroxymethylbilane synthase